ncbi:MAG: hypothetical protein Q8P31_04165 [Bacillota bacterium]|nr:hypothetical protein [Bacillota bacterium]
MAWNGMIEQLAHSFETGSAPGRGPNAAGRHTQRAARWLVWGVFALVLLWAAGGLWQGLTGWRAPLAPANAAVAAGTSLASGSGDGSLTASAAGTGGTSSREYEQALARELESLLSEIQGAGRVRVSVSLEHGPIYVFGHNTTSDSRTTDEKDASGGVRTVVETTSTRQPVILRDDSYGERALVAEEQRPAVSGILVLAEGAGASRVRLDMVRAVQALFPLPAHKITVLPMGR